MTHTTYLKIRPYKKKITKKHSLRNYLSTKWRTKSTRKVVKQHKKTKIHNIILINSIFISVIVIFCFIGVFVYLQKITRDLPSPEKPFGNKNYASEIYDRNGNLLYRVFNKEENRDIVDIFKVPPLMIWSFLSAEDITFYEHPGVDLKSMVRCGLRNFSSSSISCGASTITQQLIKQTALSSEQKYERKLKEVILAFQIEKLHSKDEILEMYLTVVPEGSNIYSVTSASQFYFGKDVSQLTLAEMTILASIPQSPSLLSPTKSSNPEIGLAKLKIRQNYVIDQMEKNMDKINSYLAKDPNQPLLTKEMLEETRTAEVTYKDPRFNIKSPHFVFYAEKLLQQRPYNKGIPFTLAELETGGYKIWTTLDSDFQAIAEEQVSKGVDVYGSRYGAENASLVVLNPKNGEMLALVGSKDYWGAPSPEGCTLGINCRFEPNVDVADTLQSYGSSMKPMAYYMAIMNGIIVPGTKLADIPIQIGSYKPKNFEGGFSGIHDARYMLSKSRNIPAIYLVDQMGVDNFVNEMKKWGYTTFTNPNGYGPSVIVGGGDVKLIEHAQAYTVFANGGQLATHEAILKIEDKDGNIIYQATPQLTQVADARGTYLINDMLNGRKGGPGVSFDGRDIAGKTGTSENQKETLFATYTPEIVVVGWLGNNDNTPMRGGTSGFGTAQPWIGEFVKRVGDRVPGTDFPRPDGIIYSGGDLAIAGIKVPSYTSTKNYLVCIDQSDRLARPIDMDKGKAMEISIKTYLMPNPSMQKYLDSYLGSKNMVPTQYCTIDRNYVAPTPPPVVDTPVVSPANILDDNYFTN
ncbi:MAG: transglycosylase domain-containing protein [bacterium]